MAKKLSDAERYVKPDETIRGGAYYVNGKWVNANGEELTKDQIKAHKEQLKAKELAAKGEPVNAPEIDNDDAAPLRGEISPQKTE